jgi:hypothetical protein
MGDIYMTPQTGKKIVKLVIGGLVMILLLVGYTFYQSYKGRVDLVNAQTQECKRAKLDRLDNAEFQRAHATYIRRVVLAQSVEEDVKRAARTALRTFRRTASGLEDRAKIDCSTVIPKASLIP